MKKDMVSLKTMSFLLERRYSETALFVCQKAYAGEETFVDITTYMRENSFPHPVEFSTFSTGFSTGRNGKTPAKPGV